MACLACRGLHQKCGEDCVMAPFFPNNAAGKVNYRQVTAIFSMRRVGPMLWNLRTPDERREAMSSILWEAELWNRDHVRGPLGEYQKLAQDFRNLRQRLSDSRRNPPLPESIIIPDESFLDSSSVARGLSQSGGRNGSGFSLHESGTPDDRGNAPMKNGELGGQEKDPLRDGEVGCQELDHVTEQAGVHEPAISAVANYMKELERVLLEGL